MKKKTLEIELIGGLGNQLFCYFAGLYISKHTNSEVQFIHNLLPEKHSQFDSRIGDLNLPIKTRTNVPKNSILRFCIRILDSLTYRVPVIKLFRDKNKYYEKRIGKDQEVEAIIQNLKKNGERLLLKGHFQDISYYYGLNFSEQRVLLHPVNPSQKFQKAIKSKELSSLTILHIRRGDFNQFASEIGLLTEEYYKAAIEKLLSYDSNLNIVTISDDMNEAKKIFPRQFNSLNRFNDNDLFSENPAELLLTMTYARNFILSNSTFSLWSGILAQHPKHIVYPFPFNLNTPLEVKGFSEKWIPVPAKFSANIK